MILCSACLLAIKCRYDGKASPNKRLIKLAKKEILIPICPEQLGGLITPREPAELKGRKILTKSGRDVTHYFIKGAKKVLATAKLLNIKQAILKQKSPSCGCGKIYDGTFSGRLIKGDGITTALLKKHGFKVISEEDLS